MAWLALVVVGLRKGGREEDRGGGDSRVTSNSLINHFTLLMSLRKTRKFNCFPLV